MSQKNKLLTRTEAAIYLRISCELIDSFTKKCPKSGEKKTLKIASNCPHSGEMFSIADLNDFSDYLSSPWPLTKSSKRPHIPLVIKKDIKRECHFSCAICGDKNNGEIAHIKPVATTYNNSPDNLLLLCPNHHTEYDYGHRVSSNVSEEEITQIKNIKQATRVRMMRYESNVVHLLNTILKMAVNCEKKIVNERSSYIRESMMKDMKDLVSQVPDLLQEADELSSKDEDTIKLQDAIRTQYHSLSKSVIGITSDSNEKDVRSSIKNIETISEDILFDLDEVECPHCHGVGVYGLHQEFCKFCNGESYVSEEERNNYDPKKVDDRECPHCEGSGQYGLTGDFCIYCKGSCRVSIQEFKDYDEDEIDETECPHCNGNGQTGLVGDLCSYCKGSCRISQEKADEYDENEIDEVNCPRCNGSGQTGICNDLCSYCKGSCRISQEKADEYDEDEIDEVECPHCHGQGQKGLNGSFCSYCKGSCRISQDKADEYDEDEIDEVECPNCYGSGLIGESYCPTCTGDTFVSQEKLDEFSLADSYECPHCEGRGVTGRKGTQCKLCKGSKQVSQITFEGYHKR